MSFVQDIATIRDLKEGPMTRTENPLDLAISGRGFFTIETEDGPRYTRNGSFQLNDAGEIVTKTNAPLLDDNGNPIVVPADARSIEIGEDGSIATELGPLARIEPVGFENEQLLKKRPDGLYEADEEQEPAPAEEARIQQGMIENSNVQPIVEMTRMIELSRSYAGAGKFTESEHERVLRAVRTLVKAQ
jgi:flagellar basal-body rod protein FlgF